MDWVFIAIFLLGGGVIGLFCLLLLLRFDIKFITKSVYVTGLPVIFSLPFVFELYLDIPANFYPFCLFAYLIGWCTGFGAMFYMFLRMLKQQDLEYKVQPWEVISGNKKVIAGYYQSKKRQIARQLETKYSIDDLEKREEYVKDKLGAIENAKRVLEEKDTFLDKQHKIIIPDDYEFHIRKSFFESLPRYIQTISSFNRMLEGFTSDFISDITEGRISIEDDLPLKSYLWMVSMYVGLYLFGSRDVRVHLRRLDEETGVYYKYLALSFPADSEPTDYSEELTPLTANDGLISLAIDTKRSVVCSANKSRAIKTGSMHLWKDYMTIVFDRISSRGKPLFSLGVSVKHPTDHKEMLYFLSYLQIEQVIQDQLLRVDEHISFSDALAREVA